MQGDGVVTRLDSLPYNHFSHILETAAEHGCDLGPYLDKTGLTEELDSIKGSSLPSELYYRILELVLSKIDIPAFGVRVGKKFSLGDYGVLGYACMSSPTLRQCLQTFFRFQQIVGSNATFSEALRVEGDLAFIEIQSSQARARLARFDIEEAVGQWSVAVEQMWRDNLSMFTRIHLSYTKPGYAQELQDLLGCPVFYDRPRSEMVFPADRLDHPIMMANALTAQLCEQQCQTILQNLTTQGGLVGQVRKLIINNPGQVPSPEEISRQLNVSYRTLRRRLSEEGSSFKEICNEVRMAMAGEYLNQTGFSTQEVAFLLGYSEASNFYRAFKQWYGKTPGEYRGVAEVA